MTKLNYKIENLSNALERSNEILSLPDSNEAKQDACVQRFEFSYKMANNTIFAAVASMGFEETQPNEIFKIAYKEGLISNLELWDNIRADRNNTTHEYNEKTAAEIYSRIPAYAKEFELVLANVQKINE